MLTKFICNYLSGKLELLSNSSCLRFSARNAGPESCGVPKERNASENQIADVDPRAIALSVHLNHSHFTCVERGKMKLQNENSINGQGLWSSGMKRSYCLPTQSFVKTSLRNYLSLP